MLYAVVTADAEAVKTTFSMWEKLQIQKSHEKLSLKKRKWWRCARDSAIKTSDFWLQILVLWKIEAQYDRFGSDLKLKVFQSTFFYMQYCQNSRRHICEMIGDFFWKETSKKNSSKSLVLFFYQFRKINWDFWHHLGFFGAERKYFFVFLATK